MSKTTAFQQVRALPLVVQDNRLFLEDSVRSKFLSVDRATFLAGRKGRSKNIYLRMMDGSASNLTGYVMPRTATLTLVTAQSSGTIDWTLEIRKNGGTISLFSLVATGGNGHSDTVNVDLDKDDLIQFFCNTSTFFGIKDPQVWIEIAWKFEE